MKDLATVLVAGAADADIHLLRQSMPGFAIVGLMDAPAAMVHLRSHGHTVAMALLDNQRLVKALDELVIFLRDTFPEVPLAVIGCDASEDRKRLQLLGVSCFLDHPLDLEDVQDLRVRALRADSRRSARDDWSVIVDGGDWVKITLPSREEYVSQVQELIDTLHRSRLGQDTRDELMLAIDELVRNAIEWGNRYDVDKQVHVSYYCADDRVVLKVEDEGEGFGAHSLADPTEDLDEHRAAREKTGKRQGGLGIHLIRSLVDDVMFNDRGNIVILTKYLC